MRRRPRIGEVVLLNAPHSVEGLNVKVVECHQQENAADSYTCQVVENSEYGLYEEGDLIDGVYQYEMEECS